MKALANGSKMTVDEEFGWKQSEEFSKDKKLFWKRLRKRVGYECQNEQRGWSSHR